MPTVTGSTQLGGQKVIGFGVITVPQFEFLIPTERNKFPNRIGWGWILARDNAAPNNIRVLKSEAVYSPGSFITFTNLYGFTNYQYAWHINFNRAGLAYSAAF